MEPFRFRLDNSTGVPVYRQLIDQVLLAISAGTLQGGGQLPTVRQVAAMPDDVGLKLAGECGKRKNNDQFDA